MVPPTTGPAGPSTANFVVIDGPAGTIYGCHAWMVRPDYPQRNKISPLALDGPVTPPMVPPTTGPAGPSTENFVAIDGLSLEFWS